MEGVSEGLWSRREEERGAAMKTKNACYQVPGSGSAVRRKLQRAEKASRAAVSSGSPASLRAGVAGLQPCAPNSCSVNTVVLDKARDILYGVIYHHIFL